MTPRTIFGATLLALALTPTARALDPGSARYMDDPGELFVFVQISDTHVGEDAGYGTQDTDSLAWTIGEAADVILPEFVVITGDLVDATNGGWIPSVQFQSEWDEYRGVLDAYGMDVTFLHDLCGNHDTYGDEGASYYLANSLVGTATGEWNETWVHAFDHGDYLFVGLNSAETLGAAPLFDDPGLAPGELAFLEEALVAHAEADLAFVFTHHPEHELTRGADEFLGLLEDHRVSAWGYGHTHQYGSAFHGQTLQLNVASAGKNDERNLGLYAVDHDGVSARATTLGSWPQVLITAPVDASLGGGNPHAYPVSANHHANPVRALVFDVSSPNSVVFSVDGGPDQPMVEVAPSVWQGEWDASSTPQGPHEIVVVATTPSGTDAHAIRVESAVTECDDGADNDGNGFVDYPDDGGCVSPSDDTEAGWTPGDDDDSAASDDDDSLPADDDDTTTGAGDPGDGCECALGGASPRGGGLAIVVLLGALALRRSRRGLPVALALAWAWILPACSGEWSGADDDATAGDDDEDDDDATGDDDDETVGDDDGTPGDDDTGPVVLIDDRMTDPAGCTGTCPSRAVEGAGAFSGAGFQTLGREDRLIYDLGQEVSSGSLEVRLSCFAPYPQYVGNPAYESQSVKFLGLFENASGDHLATIAANESIVALKYAPCLLWDGSGYVDCDPGLTFLRDDIWYNFGLQTGSCDPGCTCAADCEQHGGHDYGAPDWIEAGVGDVAPDVPGDYLYRLEWDGIGVRFYIDGSLRAEETFPVYPSCCHLDADVPRLRYLYVGRTEFFGFGHFAGPIWSDLVVTAN